MTYFVYVGGRLPGEGMVDTDFKLELFIIIIFNLWKDTEWLWRGLELRVALSNW